MTFYATGFCRRHYVRQCRACGSYPAPVPPPAFDVEILAILDALPLEAAWDDLRGELALLKINPRGLSDETRRRAAAQLVRFHVAEKDEPWRRQVLDAATHLERRLEPAREVAHA